MVIKLENNRFCSNSHFAGCNMSKSQLGQAVIAIQKKKSRQRPISHPGIPLLLPFLL
jgi:hypothetical protein